MWFLISYNSVPFCCVVYSVVVWCGVMCCTVCISCQYMTDIILHSVNVHAFTSNMISTSTLILISSEIGLVYVQYERFYEIKTRLKKVSWNITSFPTSSLFVMRNYGIFNYFFIFHLSQSNHLDDWMTRNDFKYCCA